MSKMFLGDAEFVFGFKSRRQREEEKNQRRNRLLKTAALNVGLAAGMVAYGDRIKQALRNGMKGKGLGMRSGAYRVKRSDLINDVGVGRKGMPINQRRTSEVANANLNSVNAGRRSKGLNALPAAGGTGGKPISRWKKMKMNVRAAAARTMAPKVRV
ncbi:MAG TPA: hypothetical protein V6C65_04360 [Allocoleopsis sp.]